MIALLQEGKDVLWWTMGTRNILLMDLLWTDMTCATVLISQNDEASVRSENGEVARIQNKTRRFDIYFEDYKIYQSYFYETE